MSLLRVACLYRVSTTAQADHNDIPMQREACQEYAREHGLWIIKEYQERGISAFKTPAEDRDALQKLRGDALEKRFDILLVFMFDRIGRRSDETRFRCRMVYQARHPRYQCQRGRTNSGQSYRSAAQLHSLLARWRRIQKHLPAHPDTASSDAPGRHYTGGPVTYGYRLAYTGRRNKKGKPVQDLQVCDEEAAIVKEIFARTVSEQIGTTTLANDLNQRAFVHGQALNSNVGQLRTFCKTALTLDT